MKIDIEDIMEIVGALSLKNAYDMPGFYCHNRQDYKVIVTRYHKGYRQALADVEAELELMREEKNKMKWIETQKEFPKAENGESESVLTVDSMGIMRVLFFDGSNWCYPNGECYDKARVFPVTHWMPLPSDPGKEK